MATEIEKLEPETENTAPETEATEPVTETAEPVTETPEPIVETPEPVTETVAPTAETTEPVTETPAPITETVEPVVETPAPETEPETEPAPPAEEPQPDGEAPGPAPEGPEPEGGKKFLFFHRKSPKEKKVFPKRKTLYRYAHNLDRRGLYGVMEADVILKLLCILVIFPLGQLLWKVAFLLAPRNNVTNSPIDLLLSPTLVVAALILAVGLSVLTLFENVLVIRGVDCCHRREPISVLRLLKSTAVSVLRLLKHPLNWLVLLFTAVLVPFNNGYMTMSMVSSITVPEYIEESIVGDTLLYVLYVVVGLAASWVVFQLLFLLHFMVLDDMGVVDAAKHSSGVSKGRRIRMLWQTGLWDFFANFRQVIFIFFVSMALYIGLRVGVPRLPGLEPLRASYGISMAYTAFITPFLGYITNVVLIVKQMEFFSSVYYFQKADETGEVLPVEKEKRNFRHGKTMLSLIVVTLAGAIAFSVAAAYLVDDDSLVWFVEGNKVEISSHRGYSAVAPENTVPAIQAAIDSGLADYAEIDVQMTSDGVVVLSHDENLRRCTGFNADIAETAYDVIQVLDAGSFFSEEFAGTQIPTLKEVMDVSRDKIKLMIEIKSNPKTPQLEEEVVRIIRDNDFVDQCCVVSLDYGSLEKVKQAGPEIETGYIMYMGLGTYADLPAADFFSVESTFVNEAMIDEIHLAGKKVCVWTVDKEENAEKFVKMGVDNIVTGDPVMVDRVIEEVREYRQVEL